LPLTPFPRPRTERELSALGTRSIEELQRILKDKEAYNAFFNSLDQVKTQNNVSSVAQPLLYILMACLERRNEKHRKGKAIGIGKKCSGKTDD